MTIVKKEFSEENLALKDLILPWGEIEIKPKVEKQ
jgi:hypothetical protein